jgi:mono/diheme cytochrome c family protein
VKHSGDGVVDAGAIFRGDCRRCHVGTDIKSKQGEMLYNAVCFMCHKDYSTYKHLSKGLLEKSISDGITNTSMPGFAETKGGHLSSEQISSLVNFLKNQK